METLTDWTENEMMKWSLAMHNFATPFNQMTVQKVFFIKLLDWKPK